MKQVLDILSSTNMLVMLFLVVFMILTIRVKGRKLSIFKISACSILILSYVIQVIFCNLLEHEKEIPATCIIIVILAAFLFDSVITLKSLNKEQNQISKEENDEQED